MPPAKPASSPRRATNVTLPEALHQEAKALGINISQACEAGLEIAVADARRAVWLAQNAAAIESWNAYYEKNDLTLAAYRQF